MENIFDNIFSIIAWGFMILFLWFIASRAHIMQNERIKEREEIRQRVLKRREEEKKAQEVKDQETTKEHPSGEDG